MKEKFFVVAVLCSFVVGIHGMNRKYSCPKRLQDYYYSQNGDLKFKRLEYNQKTTILFYIDAFKTLEDSDKNNIFHLIFGLHGQVPFRSIDEAFITLLSKEKRKNRQRLKAKNSEQKTPFDLIKALPELPKNHVMSLLRDKGFLEKKKPVKN